MVRRRSTVRFVTGLQLSKVFRIPSGAPLPVTGGQPCPARIPPVTLPAAEALKITRLAERYAAGLLTRARLACHLRWSHWRRRHQARARWHHYATRLAALTA